MTAGKEGRVSTDILLVRHGQTEWNQVVRFRGHTDLALDEVGQAQAHALAQRLEAWPIAAIYISPLRRARQTAQPLAGRLGLPIQPAHGLLDMDYGDWQGRTPQEVAQAEPELYRRWQEEPQQVCIPGGESLPLVQRRAVPAVEGIVAQHPNEMVLLVGHQVVNKVLICALMGLSLASFWRIGQDTACLNRFRHHDGLYDVLLLNGTCHLAGLR
jgi:broad specificity phosphatase PhoE